MATSHWLGKKPSLLGGADLVDGLGCCCPFTSKVTTLQFVNIILFLDPHVLLYYSFECAGGVFLCFDDPFI